MQELPENRCSDNDLTGGANSESMVEGSKGLLKWKGVVFTPEDGAEGATSPEDSISQITEVDNSCNQVCVIKYTVSVACLKYVSSSMYSHIYPT